MQKKRRSETSSYVQIIITSLAEKVGLEESIILSQLDYWLSKCTNRVDGVAWTYNTLQQWREQFKYWSISKIRRLFSSLEKRGYIIAKKMRANFGDQTKWYTIDFEKLPELKDRTCRFLPFVKNDKSFVQNGQLYMYAKNNSTKKESKDSSSIGENGIKKEYEEKKIFLPKKEKMEDLSEEEKAITARMIEEWNGVFSYSSKPIKGYSSRETRSKLLVLWKEVFGESMEKWKEYGVMVNSSEFLMGEKTKFKAHFAWLLEKEVVARVLGREYGVGDRKPDCDNIKKNLEEVEKELANKLRDKISSKLEHSIKHNEEEKFKNYLLSREYLRDNDPYDLKRWFNNDLSIGYELVHYSDRKESFNFYYQSYLSKKYCGMTSLEVSEVVSKFVKQSDRGSLATLTMLKQAEEDLTRSNPVILPKLIPTLTLTVN